MATFDMGRAWNEAVATLRSHGMLIAALVAFGAIAGAILQFGVFGFNNAEFTARVQALTSTGNPDPSALIDILGSAMGAVLAGSLVGGAASMAATRMALVSNGEDSIGAALVYGFIATVGLLLLYFAGSAAVALVLGVLIGLLAAVGAGVVAGILGVLLAIVLLPLMLWLLARLILATPAMASVRSTNPIYGFTQSWMMTRPVQWPLVGYLVLLIIAAIVLSLLLGLVGMIFSTVLGGSVGEALAGLVSSIPVGILSVAVTIGIWRVVAPSRIGEVFE